MANVCKIKTGYMKNFGEFADHFLNVGQHIAKGTPRTHLVLHSYLEKSIKDYQHKKRAKKCRIEL